MEYHHKEDLECEPKAMLRFARKEVTPNPTADEVCERDLQCRTGHLIAEFICYA